jgi:hypothetical protein
MAVEEPREVADGCLAGVVRVPVRVVVLVVVVPLRMAWDVLAGLARLVRRALLRPAGRAVAWLWHVLVAAPLRWLYEKVLCPLGRGVRLLAWALLVWPLTVVWRWVLVPLGRFLAAAVRAVGRWAAALAVRAARWFHAHVLLPVARAAAWLVRALVVVPLAWAYRRLLTPLGRGVLRVLKLIGLVLGRLIAVLMVWPWVLAWRYALVPAARLIVVVAGRAAGRIVAAARWLRHRVLAPAGRAALWLAAALVRWLFLAPAALLWRWLLRPAGLALLALLREIADALVWAWHLAGRMTRAIGRALTWLAVTFLATPLLWAYRRVLTPAGHTLRDAVWLPATRAVRAAAQATRQALTTARETARRAAQDARRALFGTPRAP